MSVPASFDDVKGHNTKNIRKALGGAVFAKRYDEDDAEIKQVYTEAAGLIIPSGYQSVGVLSKSSATQFARDTGTDEVESWGYGEPTRTDLTRDVTTLRFTMQESKRLAFELYNQVDLSEVTPDSDGNIVMDKPTRPQKLDWRIFVLSKDGDGAQSIYFLKWLPNCSITGVEALDLAEANEMAYTVTATGYEDPDVRTAVREVWGGPGLDAEAIGFN